MNIIGVQYILLKEKSRAIAVLRNLVLLCSSIDINYMGQGIFQNLMKSVSVHKYLFMH